ncbi:MAG: hypothetical protein IH978_04445 [Nitrospinae bacterium]|nr:hypothetical protein [Nitrospinota bacterium]
MALSDQDWEEICYVISGALANLDVKIRTLETKSQVSLEELNALKKQICKERFQTLHRDFTRTLLASHHKKTHQQQDLAWMEGEMENPDEPREPPSAP